MQDASRTRFRILVVDPEPDSRAEVQNLLVQSRHIVVGGMDYGDETVSLAREFAPEVVLVSVADPTDAALEAIRTLTGLLPRAQVIAYSSIDDMQLVRRAGIAGACDFLPAPLSAEALSQSIARGAAGEPSGAQSPIAGQQSSYPLPLSGVSIVVFGAKGGVGRTTFAAALAAALARRDRRAVALVDLDTVFGNVAALMGVACQTTFFDLIQRVDSLDESTLAQHLAPHRSGVRVLPASSQPSDWRRLDSDAVVRLLKLLAHAHDFVILDAPATFTDTVAVALEHASHIILVTSLDATSVRATRDLLAFLGSSPPTSDKVRIVVNHDSPVAAVREPEVAAALGREIFWSLPYDQRVRASAQLGQAESDGIFDGSRLAESVSNLADQFDRLYTSRGRPAAPPAKRGLRSLLFGSEDE